jgi:enolase
VELRRRLGGPVQLVGDDLLVTNIGRIRQSIERGNLLAGKRDTQCD